VIDILISIAISLHCSALRGERIAYAESSEERCRVMLNSCIYDEKNNFVECMRSNNLPHL
jgi:hypothetical protein